MLIKCIPCDTKTCCSLREPQFLCNIHGDLWRQRPGSDLSQIINSSTMSFTFSYFYEFCSYKKGWVGLHSFFLLSGDVLAGDHLQYCQQSLSFPKSWLVCKPVIHALASGGLLPFRFLLGDCSSRKFTTPQLPMQSTAPSLPC